jgi:pilus assembly protein CpaE
MQRDRRVITVLSPKGGTGKTTVSTNLAVGLGRRHPRRVVLVDLDLLFGDVAAALLLAPRRGILERLDAVVRHPSGLDVIGAPDEPLGADADVAGPVGDAIDDVARHYDFTVLDTGAGFDDVTRAAVVRSSDLVLVGSMDVPTLLGLRKVVGWLDGVAHSGARRHLVLNRAGTDVGLELGDVDATVGQPVTVAVPSDLRVVRSVNAGRPLTQDDDLSPAAEAYWALVDVLAPPVARSRRAQRHRRRRLLRAGRRPLDLEVEEGVREAVDLRGPVVGLGDGDDHELAEPVGDEALEGGAQPVDGLGHHR